MVKITSTSDFHFDIESVSLITDSKRLTKRASAKDLLRYEKTANQEDLHIIAVGAYEGTGYNRNGDCFLEKDCQENNHYFKDANRAVHRHHKNKPADPKYGNIKAAAYNEPMKRIELVVGLDRDKCADILHEQETTGNTNWSMASKQAYDVCSWCNHKAKTDRDRCEHIPRNIGELDKVGEMCGMINPDPRWFEISYVHRPADRIGMSLGKLASAYVPMLPKDYLNVYGELYVPESLGISKKASDKRELLKKLAEMEKHIEAVSKGKKESSRDHYLADHAAKLNRADGLSASTIDELRKHDPSKILKLLADNGITLGPEDFASYLFGSRVHGNRIEGMKTHLPDIFSNLEDDGEVVNNEKYEPASSGMMPPSAKQSIGKLKDDHSMFGDPAVKRIMRITIMMSGAPKLKSAPHAAERTKEAFDKELAKQYAAYKIAALNYLKENDKLEEEMMWNTLLQNRK